MHSSRSAHTLNCASVKPVSSHQSVPTVLQFFHPVHGIKAKFPKFILANGILKWLKLFTLEMMLLCFVMIIHRCFGGHSVIVTTLFLLKSETDGPWLVWLSGLSTGLQTKGLLVRFPVRAHAWVAGQVPSRGHVRGNHTLMFLSLSFSLPPPL